MPVKYLPTMDMYVGQLGMYDPEEIKIADEIETEWSDRKKMTPVELVQIFPEAKQIVLKNIKEKMARSSSFLNELLQIQRHHNNSGATDTKNISLYNHWIDNIEQEKKEVQNNIKKLVFLYRRIKSPDVTAVTSGGITDTDILRAKEVPIENFYPGQLRRYGKRMSGKCEFHNETAGSLTIYTDQNSWYCYGCCKGGSVVDYIMNQQGLDFLQAVKFILK